MESKLNQCPRNQFWGKILPVLFYLPRALNIGNHALYKNSVYVLLYRANKNALMVRHKNQYKRSTAHQFLKSRRGREVFQFTFFNLFSCNLRIMEEGVSLHFLLRDRVLSILGKYSKKTSTILWLVLGLQTYSWVLSLVLHKRSWYSTEESEKLIWLVTNSNTETSIFNFFQPQTSSRAGRFIFYFKF